MQPHPTPIKTPIQVRFGDTDALGHVNNAAYAAYVEHARLDFLERLGAEVGSLILAHLAIDFRKQVRFGEEVYVTTAVAKLGNSSVTLQQTIVASGTVAAEVRSVVVLYDYQAQRPQRIPEALREKLERQLVSA